MSLVQPTWLELAGFSDQKEGRGRRTFSYLLPLEAGHACYTVQELSVGEAVSAALLCLNKPQDLGQSALGLGGGQDLPLDLLGSRVLTDN